MKKYRKEKVQELIRREITSIIQYDVKDPRIQGFININEVDIASDLKSAKVYVSIFGIDEEKANETFNGLINALNFIKFKLSKNTRLKYIPKISFIRDRSVERGVKIVDKLEKLKKERGNSDVEREKHI